MCRHVFEDQLLISERSCHDSFRPSCDFPLVNFVLTEGDSSIIIDSAPGHHIAPKRRAVTRAA
jgi:hypothetical protein